MTINEARANLEKLESDLEYYLNEKEIIKPLPKASDITLEKVQGGTRSDKMINYVMTLEEKNIDNIINSLQDRIQNLNEWIERELKILGKYEPLKREIVVLKEESKLTYYQISQRVGYSERQVRRIYKLAVGHRNIW